MMNQIEEVSCNWLCSQVGIGFMLVILSSRLKTLRDYDISLFCGVFFCPAGEHKISTYNEIY